MAPRIGRSEAAREDRDRDAPRVEGAPVSGGVDAPGAPGHDHATGLGKLRGEAPREAEGLLVRRPGPHQGHGPGETPGQGAADPEEVDGRGDSGAGLGERWVSR